MNKKLIVVLMAILTIKCNAQLQKGGMFAGGNINFYGDNRKIHDSADVNQGTNYSFNSFNVNLNYGYLLNARFALGVFGNFSFNNTSDQWKNQNPQPGPEKFYYNTSRSGYAFGLFGRGFLPLKESRFVLFAQLNGAYGMSTSQTEINYNFDSQLQQYTVRKTGTDSKEINFGLSPGIIFFINKHFGIETSLGSINYRNSKDKHYLESNTTGYTYYNRISANFSMSSFYFGLNYYFGGN